MSETYSQMLQRQTREADARARKAQRDLLCFHACKQAGLPEEFEKRLQGDDADSLNADAKQLAAELEEEARSRFKTTAVGPTPKPVPKVTLPEVTDEQRQASLRREAVKW